MILGLDISTSTVGYTFIENKQIVENQESEMPVQSNNGTQPEGQASFTDEVQAEVTASKPRRTRAKSKPSEINEV